LNKDIAMEMLKKLMKNSPSIAISIPAILCFVQFVYEVIEIFETGEFNMNTINQLASSANGFEAVCLFIIMLVLKEKK